MSRRKISRNLYKKLIIGNNSMVWFIQGMFFLMFVFFIWDIPLKETLVLESGYFGKLKTVKPNFMEEDFYSEPIFRSQGGGKTPLIEFYIMKIQYKYQDETGKMHKGFSYLDLGGNSSFNSKEFLRKQWTVLYSSVFPGVSKIKELRSSKDRLTDPYLQLVIFTLIMFLIPWLIGSIYHQQLKKKLAILRTGNQSRAIHHETIDREVGGVKMVTKTGIQKIHTFIFSDSNGRELKHSFILEHQNGGVPEDYFEENSEQYIFYIEKNPQSACMMAEIHSNLCFSSEDNEFYLDVEDSATWSLEEGFLYFREGFFYLAIGLLGFDFIF